MESIVNGTLVSPAPSAGAAPPSPRWAAVAGEQLRSIAGGVRREAAGGAALMVLLPLPMLIQHARTPGRPTDMQFVQISAMCVLVGLFAPMAVWKGEGPAGRGYFWTLPVDRARHSLVKVAAGWGWMMAVVGVLLLWWVLLAWMTGGGLNLGDTRVPLRPYSDVPRPTPADYFVHPWPVNPWLWIVPFTATTFAYLAGSAVALSADHPWRWYAGFVLCWALLSMAGLHEELGQLIQGRYGWGAMVTGGEWKLTALQTPVGAMVRAGRFVADPPRWALATALWMALALAAVVFAARRHQER